VSTPASRSLPVVLRRLTTSSSDAVGLLVGTLGPPPAASPQTYATVILDGQTLVIPKLAGVSGSEGQPAYILTAPGRMILIGTITN
jgi:hypothetical protein